MPSVRIRQNTRIGRTAEKGMRGAVTWAACMLGAAAGAARAQAPLTPPTPQIEAAVRMISAQNRRPLCASPEVPNPEQLGFQEIMPSFAPGQWVLRIVPLPQHKAALARLDHFAQFGLLERRDAFIEYGPIQALPAIEYRVTLKGWQQNMAEGGWMPCFYYGMTRIEATGYTESVQDAAGVRRIAVEIRTVAGELEPWAAADGVGKLFWPIARQIEGQKGKLTLIRGPDGKLRRSASDKVPFDDRPEPEPEAALPGVAAAAEGIERTLASPGKTPGLVMPQPCLQLLSKYMNQLWKAGDAAAAKQAILQIPQSGSRDIALLTYTRLDRLARAGMFSLQGNASTGQVVAVPARGVEELLARHGNCLPLGKVRIVVDRVLRDRFPGVREKFKARYIVEQPAPWIRALKHPEALADLQATLKYGQPFEGTTVKMPDGWRAAYPVDRRPLPTAPSLTSVGVSPVWRNVSESGLAGASVANHEVHLIGAYSAPAPSPGGAPARRGAGATQHAMGRVDVVVQARPRPMLLLLNGYEPIEWHFKLEAGARVDAVLAVGYYEQRVAGLPGLDAGGQRLRRGAGAGPDAHRARQGAP